MSRRIQAKEVAMPAYPGLPPQDIRDNVAEIVHEAVCAVHGSDGYGRCADYARAGALACSLVTGRTYVPQAGSLQVLSHLPHGYLTIDARDGGFDRHEFHCWTVTGFREEGGQIEHYIVNEWVDFSTRHFRAMNDRLTVIEDVVSQDGDLIILTGAGRALPWSAPDPPTYVWSEGNRPPEGIYYQAESETNQALIEVSQYGTDPILHELMRQIVLRVAAFLGVSPGKLLDDHKGGFDA